MRIHPTGLAAVQAQPAPAVTVTTAEPPVEPNAAAVGATETEQAAACVNVTVRPATVTVAVRGDVVGLGGAESATVPLPEPDMPLVTLTHAGVLATVHPQMPAASTDRAAVPPAAANVAAPGVTAYVHEGSVTPLRFVQAVISTASVEPNSMETARRGVVRVERMTCS
jgi:hypothetical protein